MRNIRYICISILASLIACLSYSCKDEYTANNLFTGIGTPVSFDVSLAETGIVDTRAEETGNPGLDSIYVAADPWSLDFYIQLNTTDSKTDAPIPPQYGVYYVPSAYVGRLESKEPYEPLNWQNLDKPHTFYAWTVPWMETAPKDFAGASVGKNYGTWNTTTKEEYVPSGDTIPVYFYNSSEEHGFNENHNNSIYEGFIGAKSESYTYVQHGKYVGMTFHHLVSRIKVESLILIQPDGSIQKDLQADMTFVGMPVKATFYPHPTTGDGSGAPERWRPYVGKPYIDSPDTGVTYYIHNRANTQDYFYICPETNFSDIDYQIKINTKGYETLQTYYGTFDEVVFERRAGWGYDQGDDETGNNIDSKILHAGEEMRLHIVLIPGRGPGLKVIIENWSTDKPVESQYHSHPGFYTESELQQMLDLLYSINSSNYDNPPDELELLFEMYGYKDDEGNKYFPLYSNMTPMKGNSVSNIFPVPPGYIIDGMGHTVTLKTNYGNYWPSGYSNYFNVGGVVRDIYFSDENGNNTIYIDPEGYVWITNSQGVLEQTNNRIPETLPDGVKGYDISCRTGELRPTGYYNDNITG